MCRHGGGLYVPALDLNSAAVGIFVRVYGNMRHVSNLRRKLIWGVLLPLAVLAAAVISLPYWLNSLDYKALLILQAEEQLGRKVEIRQANVEVLPKVRVSLEGVSVKERDGQATFLTADRLFAEIRIFPLLTRKIAVKRITLDRPRLFMRRGADGQWNTSDLVRAGESSFSLPMLGEAMTITDGELVIEDAFESERPRTLLAQRVNLSYKTQAREFSLKAFAALPQDQGESMLSATLRVPRQTVAPYEAGDRVEGTIEAKRLDLRHLAFFVKQDSALSGVRGVADLTSGIEYRWNRGILSLKEFNLKAVGATVKGSGVLVGLGTEHKKYTVSLKATPFRLETLMNSLSVDLFREKPLKFLGDSQAAATIRIGSLRLSGALSGEQPTAIQGEVDVSDGRAFIGKHQTPLSHVKGVLRVQNDRLIIDHLSGRYGNANVTFGRGEITSLQNQPELTLAAKGKVSAQELAVIVARFSPKGVLPQGPAGLSGLSGEADAKVLITGHLDRLDDLDVEWSLDARQVRFTDARFSLPVSNLHGEVHSSGRSIVFQQVAGSVGKSAVVLNGDISYPLNRPVRYDLRLGGDAEVGELLSVWGEKTNDAQMAQGRMPFLVGLSGEPDALRLIGSLDLLQVAVGGPGGIGKATGIPGTLQFNAVWNPGHWAKLERVFLEIPPLLLHARGSIAIDASPQFALNVHIPPVSLRALPKDVFGTVTPSAGSFRAEVAIGGPFDNWRALKVKGRASVRHAAFTMEKLKHRVEDLSVDVAFDDDRVEIQRGSIKVDESLINVKGAIRGWRGIPVVDIVMDSPGMDLQILIPEGERSPMRTAVEAIARGTRFSGTAAIRNGTYHGLQFEEVRAKVTAGDGVLVLDPVNGSSAPGTVVGQARINLSAGAQTAFESTVHIDSLPVDAFLHSLGVNAPTFSGSLKMEGSLRGTPGAKETLNGEVGMAVEKGHFRKLSATAKIIGLLNLPSLLAGKVDFSNQGMPFDCLIGHVAINNGIVNIKDYVMHSAIMKITAVGTYDIPHDQYDVKMVASPFGSYGEFIQSIPFVGKLFLGDRQSLVTAVFAVKGPLEDPSVTALPFKSAAQSIGAAGELALDLMKNAILFPIKMFMPSQNNGPAPCSPTSQVVR